MYWCMYYEITIQDQLKVCQLVLILKPISITTSNIKICNFDSIESMKCHSINGKVFDLNRVQARKFFSFNIL